MNAGADEYFTFQVSRLFFFFVLPDGLQRSNTIKKKKTLLSPGRKKEWMRPGGRSRTSCPSPSSTRRKKLWAWPRSSTGKMANLSTTTMNKSQRSLYLITCLTVVNFVFINNIFIALIYTLLWNTFKLEITQIIELLIYCWLIHFPQTQNQCCQVIKNIWLITRFLGNESN